MGTRIYSLLIVIMVLFLTLSGPLAFAESKKQIIITGTIDTGLIAQHQIKYIGVKILDVGKKLNKEESIITVPLQRDGSFNLIIPSNSQFTYLSFLAEYRKGGEKVWEPITTLFAGGISDQSYLFNDGDSCGFQLFRNGMFRFSGENSEKLNLQSDLYNFKPFGEHIAYIKTRLIATKHIDETWQLLNDLLSTELQAKIVILESYKTQMDSTSYKQIRLDLIGKTQYEFILLNVVPWLGALEKSERQKVRENYLQFSRHLLIDTITNNSNVTLKMVPAYYSDFILLKERLDCAITQNTPTLNSESYLPLFYKITGKYSGAFRDELLLKSVIKLNKLYSEEIKSRIWDLKKVIQNPLLKAALDSFYRDQSATAFPLELEDAYGKLHKLSDYKGKLLIIDFWFTGCVYCAILKANMEPIVDLFKDHKDVVFISVSTDKDKNTWLKSISSGIYTTNRMVNLYTNGLGSNHPLIKHYGYQGAPQQLIIGRDGKVITATPTRPSSTVPLKRDNGIYRPNPNSSLAHPSTQTFIKIIKDNL